MCSKTPSVSQGRALLSVALLGCVLVASSHCFTHTWEQPASPKPLVWAKSRVCGGVSLLAADFLYWAWFFFTFNKACCLHIADPECSAIRLRICNVPPEDAQGGRKQTHALDAIQILCLRLYHSPHGGLTHMVISYPKLKELS